MMNSEQTKYEAIAFELRPEGFVRVRSGEILPDDLLFSAFEDPPRFRPAADPAWNGPGLTDAADAVYCIRKAGRVAIWPGYATAGRSYSIRRGPIDEIATLYDRRDRNVISDDTRSGIDGRSRPKPRDPQGSLFD